MVVNAIGSALLAIHSTIQMETLEAAFKPYKEDVCLDYIICRDVIEKRVLNDINLRGGKTHSFVLDYSWVRYMKNPSAYVSAMGGNYSTFLIPPEARDHREIIAVTRVELPYVTTHTNMRQLFNNGLYSGNDMQMLSRKVLSSKTMSNMEMRPIIKVRAGNVLQVSPAQISNIPWKITVRLGYDKEFTNMGLDSIDIFRNLCVEAVKSYIYNVLIYEIETNVTYRGMEIGVMKDLVSGYSDANDKYEELLIEMTGSEIMDIDRVTSILRLALPHG